MRAGNGSANSVQWFVVDARRAFQRRPNLSRIAVTIHVTTAGEGRPADVNTILYRIGFRLNGGLLLPRLRRL
jgi:hypothetical protein